MKKLSTLIATLTAASCGGQVGEETVVCDAVERVALSEADESPLGFSAGDALTSIEGTALVPVQWADDTVSEATIVVTYSGGTIEFQDREWIDDEGGAEIAIGDCSDVVSIDVTLAIATADGRLDESWTASIEAESSSSVLHFRELETFDGSLDVESFAPSGDWDAIRSFASLTWIDGALRGDISGQASGEDGDAAFAQGFDIAALGTPQE